MISRKHQARPASIVVDPPAHVFDAKNASQLRQRLIEAEKGTMMGPIGTAAAMQIQRDGTTPTGYRYTSVAMQQLCQSLGSGLSYLITDLAGVNRRPDQPKEEFSLALATDVLNQIIKLRFGRIRERQLIRSIPNKTIDGIVGPYYRFLSNASFYERINNSVKPKTQLHEALLYGRYLALRYILPDHRFVINISGQLETFTPGYYFKNSEIGESSVRTAVVFVRESTGDSCLSPFISRTRHQGKDFDGRLGRLMLTTSSQVHDADYYREKVVALLNQNLGLGKGDKQDEKTKKKITDELAKQGLMQWTADQVLTSAIVSGDGHYTGDAAVLARQHLVLTSRTAYDVFTTLMREARKLAIDTRETVEQAAYALLVGRFCFNE
jgi:hypothetical protein